MSRKPSWRIILLSALSVPVLLVCLLLVLYQPDRPVATITPGSSSQPAFVVQVIRPRLGLPLGGILPPRLFNVDAHLGFDSNSQGAEVRSVVPGRIELGADDWNLVLVWDDRGRVTSDTEVVFELLFEEVVRKVRCRPAEPAVGKLTSIQLKDAGDELSGSFDIELPCCEDADTGQPLGWPPEPFVLHGSFDRLPLDTD